MVNWADATGGHMLVISAASLDTAGQRIALQAIHSIRFQARPF
jgi:hypothetical protein